LAAAFALMGFFMAAGIASAATSLIIRNEKTDYVPGEALRGDATLKHDTYISQAAIAYAYIDDRSAGQLPLQGIIRNISYYSFPPHLFSYELVARGTNTWTNSPEQAFNYSIDVEGSCGKPSQCCNVTRRQCWCDCEGYCGNQSNPSSYPCRWNVTQRIPFDRSTVMGTDGLKLIYNGLSSINIPDDANPDTAWSELANSNFQVKTTMRQACGGETYSGNGVLSNGWVRQRQLDPGTWLGVGADRYTNIEPFDHNSLTAEGRRNYTNDYIGGIYKDGAHQQYGTGAVWNGTTGFVKILNYNSNSNYYINYLPPNGPRLCAYTSSISTGSQTWRSALPYSSGAFYNQPYTRQFLPSSLPQPPACPAGSVDCVQTVAEYYVNETSDADGTVGITYNAGSRTVTAVTSSRQLSQSYTELIGMGFPGLSTRIKGSHVLKLEVREGLGAPVLAYNTSSFAVCDDADGDGYCSLAQGGLDCDDSDASRHPGANELCNNKDDDCDGVKDEGIFFGDRAMGSACGGQSSSACAGVWVCKEDGSDAVCARQHSPGELLEVCDNGIDDDCDGGIDEANTPSGEPDCWCSLTSTKACGSNLGICRQGLMVCELSDQGFPVWSACKGSELPQTEACNTLDDDCDGVVDDVSGGTNKETSKCGCYGGALPAPESCNDIDDDCDGQVDEGLSCCQDGDTRACGTDTGACSVGVQTCFDNSWQASECEGSIDPKAEICYNEIDDDCDGEVDEGCDPSYTCANRLQDLNENGVDCGDDCPRKCMAGPVWMVIAGVMIFIFLGVWLLVLKKKI